MDRFSGGDGWRWASSRDSTAGHGRHHSLGGWWLAGGSVVVFGALVVGEEQRTQHAPARFCLPYPRRSLSFNPQ